MPHSYIHDGVDAAITAVSKQQPEACTYDVRVYAPLLGVEVGHTQTNLWVVIACACAVPSGASLLQSHQVLIARH